MLDRKTREHVDFLAAMARRFGNHYINNAIIPILCGMVGVPTADVRGNITSHRARSTIASQLYNGAFLRHLETNRGNTASAQCPPAAIHSFFRYAVLRVPEHTNACCRSRRSASTTRSSTSLLAAKPTH
jgi:hypothetical protein